MGGVSGKAVEICTEGLLLRSLLFSCRKPIWIGGRTRQGDTLKCIIENFTYTRGSVNVTSNPKAIIRNESTGASGITRLSPTVEGSGMVLDVSGTT